MDNLTSKIEKKAYEHFITRGMAHGRDVEDWLMAEKEILTENGKSGKHTAKKKKSASAYGKNNRRKKSPDADLETCTKAPDWAEHQRASDPDEPCNEGRAWGM